jgi:hypothetical protein
LSHDLLRPDQAGRAVVGARRFNQILRVNDVLFSLHADVIASRHCRSTARNRLLAETLVISVGRLVMRRIYKALARSTQSDERALKLAFFAVVLSAIVAITLERILL